MHKNARYDIRDKQILKGNGLNPPQEVTWLGRQCLDASNQLLYNQSTSKTLNRRYPWYKVHHIDNRWYLVPMGLCNKCFGELWDETLREAYRMDELIRAYRNPKCHATNHFQELSRGNNIQKEDSWNNEISERENSLMRAMKLQKNGRDRDWMKTQQTNEWINLNSPPPTHTVKYTQAECEWMMDTELCRIALMLRPTYAPQGKGQKLQEGTRVPDCKMYINWKRPSSRTNSFWNRTFSTWFLKKI